MHIYQDKRAHAKQHQIELTFLKQINNKFTGDPRHNRERKQQKNINDNKMVKLFLLLPS